MGDGYNSFLPSELLDLLFILLANSNDDTAFSHHLELIANDAWKLVLEKFKFHDLWGKSSMHRYDGVESV